MKIFSLLLLISFTAINASSQELEKAQQQIVLDFINTVKTNNKDSLAAKISYPLWRSYPITEVTDKQDFIKRYSELFDDKLIKMIINSNPSVDWHAAGFRGIMLLNGAVWLKYDGKLTAINYKTAAGSKRLAELIEADRNRLHSSIKIFENPKVILETSSLRIRIDDLGSGNYRYASWPIKSSMKDKPDLVLAHGELIPDGSGGNHRYSFKDDDYTYECAIMNFDGSTIPPALLTVLKDGKEVLKEPAKILK